MLVLSFIFYNQKYHKLTCEKIPINNPTSNSIFVCDFIYSLEDATKPIHNIDTATLFTKGNS